MNKCNGCEYLHIRKFTASNMCAIWMAKCEAYSDKDGDNWIEFIASEYESVETPDWCMKENDKINCIKQSNEYDNEGKIISQAFVIVCPKVVYSEKEICRKEGVKCQ